MKFKRCSHDLQSNYRSNSQRFCKLLMSKLINLCHFPGQKKKKIRSSQNLFISRCCLFFCRGTKVLKRACKSLFYYLEPIVQHCTRAALARLINAKIFPALSKNRLLAECFASCENIVSRSQALFPSPPPPPLRFGTNVYQS